MPREAFGLQNSSAKSLKLGDRDGISGAHSVAVPELEITHPDLGDLYMRNFLKAALVVSFLVPAISFAGDAPKAGAGSGSAAAKTDAKSDAKTDTKTPAKTDAKKPAAKTPAKKDAPAKDAPATK
jgi:hypothetical protein